jgi:hypothetical protein
MVESNLKRLVWLGILAEICVFLFSYFSSVFEINETFRLAARYSGRLSLFFFLAIFWITSKNWKSRRTDFKDRFIWLTSIFSLLHGIHFIFISLNVYLNEIELIPYKLLGGALGYVLLLTYPWFLKHKNLPEWLDYIYFYYLILIMTVTILSRLNGAFEGAVPSPLHYIGLSFIIVVIIVHLIQLFKNP